MNQYKSKLRNCFICLIVFILGALLIQFFRYNEFHCGNQEFGNTASNFVQGQWVAKNDDGYYFIHDGICKVTKDGQVMRIIEYKSEDGLSRIRDLGVIGKYIYYVKDTATGGPWQIVRLNTDICKEEKLYQTDNMILSFQVVDRTLYFSEGGKVYRMKDEEKEPKEIQGIEYRDTYLQSLYLKGWVKKEWHVRLAYQTDYGQIHGKWMYAYKEEELRMPEEDRKRELYRLSSDGKKEEKLGENILNYNVSENCIYYAQKRDSSVHMYRMDFDGTNKVKLSEDSFKKISRIHDAGDKIFFQGSQDGKNFDWYWMDTTGGKIDKLVVQ